MSRALRQVLASAAAVVVMLTPVLVETQTTERSRTQGLKETDRFVKAGGSTSQAIAAANNQVKSTLDAFNALVTQPSTNMKGAYKKVMKAGDSMNDRVAEARQKIDAMQEAGTVYFGGRAETIKNIQDPQLQTKAQQRLETSQKEFAEVLQQMHDAGEALEPFRKQLADQITFLGSDLTPSATASLKPEADKLNKQGAEVYSNADRAITKANAYFQGLRSES
jgi:hypothetical protein